MKNHYVIIIFSALVLLVMTITGCPNTTDQLPYIDFNRPADETVSQKEDSVQRPIFIALASVMSPHETIIYYRKIADYVSKETGRPAVLVQRKTYAEVNLLLANGDVDIAFLSTGAYSSYQGMNEIEPLVMTEHDNSVLYTADVIVHKDSNIHSISDLQGKVFAFTDPLSYSGHMVIEDYLRDHNTLPERFFQRYFYTYSHDKSLWAVANHIADGASFDSQIYEYVKIRNPELAANVRIITSMEPAPTGPVVISQRVPPEQKEELRRIFLSMHQDPETAAAMQKLVIDRFVPPAPDLYDPLRKLYKRTGARP
ncbi:substrate-binding domain-containing protein [Propionispora hippei]|uniref:Phosphonate transport system substrate-binding protein n=1 Tax=Propionispora hippei DSM 15287 TaxID=1123003 RepID=A0A1M6PCD0_9FIRM|nr:phosphate/phosphite/phosphonate ABC transporter substrate-binding protein [Propionispora hippei]SHK05577.1 phosphonate transport system substrate-binding protein [Propionispora hippei DSM 15287]